MTTRCGQQSLIQSSSSDGLGALRNRCATDVPYGSIGDTNRRGRHGRTCFNTGRQGTQPLCILLIDGLTVTIKGKRRARSTSITGRHGRRPRHLQRAIGLNRYRDSAHFEVGSQLIGQP
jgi:hypothetical protein